MINKISEKIVMTIGIILCLVVFSLNIIYVARIADVNSENVLITRYGMLNTILTGLLIVGVISISKKLNKVKCSKKLKITILVILLVMYAIAQIGWIQVRQAMPAYDSKSVYKLAVDMYNNKWDEIKQMQYFELYPQQLSLSATFYIIMKIFNTTSSMVLQYMNVVANVLTVIALLLISNQLSKKYTVNKIMTLVLILGFIPLSLLVTFVYGDLISFPMCLFSIYFIMKYTNEEKNRYAIISAIFMSLAYIFRMNSLICIIAVSIYIILDIFKIKDKNAKSIVLKIVILIAFTAISMIPGNIIKVQLQNKMELNKEKKYPAVGFLYMGMEESYRANGWYSDYGAWAWNDVEGSIPKYQGAIVGRVQYFMQHPKYFVRFYINKIASMWAENTYGSLWYNQSFNIGEYKDVKVDKDRALKIDEQVRGKAERIILLQKAIVVIIFGSTILVLIKNRKNMSNEILLLIITFIGGFLFHILWEAKSRYIILYIIVLIPVASISLEGYGRSLEDKLTEKFRNVTGRLKTIGKKK